MKEKKPKFNTLYSTLIPIIAGLLAGLAHHLFSN